MASPRHHASLFHPRLVRARVAELDPELYAIHADKVQVWLQHLKQGTLNTTSEVSLHGGFLERIFGDVLGYSTMATACDGKWDLVAEKRVLDGGSADGALGIFADGQSHVVAPIELKAAVHLLDDARGKGRTPIQQGWDYANCTPESQWIIVSNYRETRLYAKGRGTVAYEAFHLRELAKEGEFLRFAALLGRDALLGGPSPKESPLAQMLISSERAEREITAQLYAQYRDVRAKLFGELQRTHSQHPPDELLGYTQTILDRVLFIAFAEDRGLLPSATLAKAFAHSDPYNPRPVWNNFVHVFHAVDKGQEGMRIPAYNGGLFRERPELDELEVSDEVCAALRDLGDYDFGDDVSVDVLGHIFEQSITDLERLRNEAESVSALTVREVAASIGTQRSLSRRKKEGIFYTPAFVTAFLVQNTLGLAIQEARDRAFEGRQVAKKSRVASWKAYQVELRKLRVLDPACGSGAFLVAAYTTLAQEFELARRMLEELTGATASLFDPTRAVLNENVFGVDRSGESVEITKLSLWLQTAQRGSQLTSIDRNIRKGNSVVSDATLDAWAFDWDAGRIAQPLLESDSGDVDGAAEVDARWREGFDVVLGNPPYVRQELLTEYKDHWKDEYSVFDGTADLFVYFIERGIRQLKPGGRLGFVVSNKWFRGGYAEKLRGMLSSQCTIQSIVDFGHAPVFPDADAFPCIITLVKSPPSTEHPVRITQFPRNQLGEDLLASFVESNSFEMPQIHLKREGWTLEPEGVQALLDQIESGAAPLGEYVDADPYYGIKTGFNEAFLVDNAVRDQLCREDPRSQEVLKKYLRGQDIARWSPEWSGQWMLALSSSANRKWPWASCVDELAAESVFAGCYPALHTHMKTHETRLRKRSDQGRFWWELRPCAYYDAFEQPKLVWKDISFHSSFATDSSGMYTNDLCFVLPSEDRWLLAVLNSPAAWVWLWRKTLHGKDEALRLKTTYMLRAPVPTPNEEQLVSVNNAVDSIVEDTRSCQSSIDALIDSLLVQFDVEKTGNKLADFPSLTSDEFAREVSSRRPKKGPRLSPARLRELRTLHESEAPSILEKRAHILKLERTIATAVHEAFGLSAANLELMRATQPPRMPPGW